MSVSELPESAVSQTRLKVRNLIGTLLVLFKFRVVTLLLLAAAGGAFLGAAGWPGVPDLALVLITGWLAASGASALNQYWERDRDGLMGRTRRRPLVTGAISLPRQAWLPYVGVAMILLPVLAVLPYRPALSFYLFLGAFIYVAIYTIWLKPRTLLNIVIGGAAGSAAVMSGGAAVGAAGDPGVIVLALLVFLWTPSHFWSLAILYRDDYRQAGTPMLPARVGPRAAAWWVLLHTAATGLAAVLLALTPALGWVYLAPVLLVTVDLHWRNARLIREPTPQRARSLFMASNLFLSVILLAATVDVLLPF